MPTLHWIGKDKVINHHLDVPFRVLEHKYNYRLNDDLKTQAEISGNKIIHGDNLSALKALLPEFEGKIKCIYIDPPYNTGNESWVYNDNVNDPKIRKWLNTVVGREGEDLSRHDKWLCMMYPRLKLLHKLLADDGAIFISIDDNEQANLKLIMDEIFGMGNFVTNIIWQKIHSIKNDAKHLSVNHDFVLLYSKNIDSFQIKLLQRSEKMDSRYKNPDLDTRGPWQSGDLVANEPRKDGNYDVFGPTGKTFNVPPDKHWVYSKENLMKMIEENRIWFGKTGDSFPRKKRFLSEVQQGKTPDTWWTSDEVGHNQEAKREIKGILNIDNQTFSTPKPVRLMERIFQLSSDKNSIILDSFAGSGTTAHAVLNLNKQDGGNRKFILIEMEEYAESITAERVRRVMNGYGDAEGTGGSFDFYELGEPLFDEDGNLNEKVGVEKIRQYIWYTETKTNLNQDLRDLSDEPDSKRLNENNFFLGKHNDTAYYFYYKPEEVTTLDLESLSIVKEKEEQYVIYADNCLLAKDYMRKHNIIFKKIPRDIRRF